MRYAKLTPAGLAYVNHVRPKPECVWLVRDPSGGFVAGYLTCTTCPRPFVTREVAAVLKDGEFSVAEPVR